MGNMWYLKILKRLVLLYVRGIQHYNWTYSVVYTLQNDCPKSLVTSYIHHPTIDPIFFKKLSLILLKESIWKKRHFINEKNAWVVVNA